MRFIIDESIGPAVGGWLRQHEHEVYSVFNEAIIRKAFSERWILITNDKDFGEKVYRNHYPHNGVILLRLEDERASVKIRVMDSLLSTYSHRLEGEFVVVSERDVRFARS